MKKYYSHLSWTDRLRIEKMRKEGAKVTEIADALHVHYSTVYRELKRGTYTHLNTDLTTEERYSPDIAQAAYDANLTAKGPELKIGHDIHFAAYIEDKIVNEHYSPAAVLGEIKAKNITFETTVCLRTLYSYIDKGVFLRITNKDLPHRGKRKEGRHYRNVRASRPPRGESIEQRPDEVKQRKTMGHWEMDTVVGCKKSKPVLLVLTERLSRREIILKMKDRTASSTVNAINRLERRYGKSFFKALFRSITVDNGVEFADCSGLEGSIYGGQRTKIYYCHPYSSWERGSNENQNALLRRTFPKGTDFTRVTHKAIAAAEMWLNTYPRAMFGYRCAEDVFQEHLALL